LTKVNLENIGKILVPEQPRTDSTCYGRVDSINDDGSFQVQLNASATKTRCANLCGAAVNDRVLVLIQANGHCAANGRVGGSMGAIADYIIETGETDGWHWEKWYSGKAEAWATKAHARVCNQQYGNAWYSDQCQDSFPAGLFTQIDACMLSADSSGPGYAIETGGGVTVEHTQVYWLFRCEGGGSNFTAYIHILVKGRWK
jgi:hypothetical protein